MFGNQAYQEAYVIYEDLLQNEDAYSPAMLLKMAFIAEGTGDFSKASFYLAKYYDENPNPRVITKIKTLTEQSSLVGYELTDRDRFLKFLTDVQSELTAVFAFLLIVSLILLLVYNKNVIRPKYYLPTIFLLVLVFVANNFLSGPKTGIVTGSPTLVMDKPTAGGKLIKVVDPGHRVVIKSSKDIWYEVKWGDRKAYVKKESVTRL
ncbi:SH3 domain-containing protein [Arthrospiribacter ruber]|uniref:SH3 domain-containing protein n=1 Tax=Arthrospiribacter ruber TaxID=2487934 RepID=UPI0031B8A092